MTEYPSIAAAWHAPDPVGAGFNPYTTAARSYRYWRSMGRNPADSLQRAQIDAMFRKRRYSAAESGRSGGFGAEFEIGGYRLRWTEDARASGLRFVGWSDEIAELRHTGWYVDSDFQEGTLRGCVYQLPARGGRPLYVAAYREGSSRDRHDWRDTSTGRDGHAAAIDLESLWEGEPGGLGNYGSASYDPECRAAARAADSIAERVAEYQRDYREAANAGIRYADLGETLSSARREALQLIREAKASCAAIRSAGESITAAVQREIRAAVRDVAEMRRERAQLWNDWADSRLSEPFREYAGARPE